MPSETTSVAIIGCGHVGVACASSLLSTSLVRELVLINHSDEVAQGEALDLQQASPLGSPVRVTAGTYADAAVSQIVVLTAAAPGKLEGSRLDMLAANADVVRDCVGQLVEAKFEGILLLATNPVDVTTYIAQKEFGLAPERVIGTGTLIDSERMRSMLGDALKVDARSVHVAIIGEHGDSSVPVWSAAQAGGMPLADFPGAKQLPSYEELRETVQRAGPEISKLKGNTCFAIAACVTRICTAILRDEHSVLVVSTVLGGEYGLQDVSLSTPCVIGKTGVERVLELPLNSEEKSALLNSAFVLDEAYEELVKSEER